MIADLPARRFSPPVTGNTTKASPINSMPARSWLHGLGALTLAAISAWLAWWAPAPGSLALRALVGFAAQLLLTASFAAALESWVPRQSEASRLRLAFAASLGFGLAAASRALWPAAAVFAGTASMGSFAGALWATSRQTPLWEDNYPPALDLAARVLDAHRIRLGSERPSRADKRAFDLLLGSVGGLVAMPVMFLVCLALWLEDPGPLFFVKNSVGRGGRNFRQWKIRTMVRSAEEATGPVLAGESDERVLFTGRLLRRTALDELPQLLNILQGTMSFVGPRPQRTVLVDQYLAQIPEYADRHRVAPGLAGLAQVAGDYYLTPRQKLRFDRLYVQHASLGFDLKLIAIACAVVFWLRWSPGWNGRVPRAWLRWPGRGSHQTQIRFGPEGPH
jgi:lipopolysaccharide/colanic/teichoic acid biosynthesis glycosyltransferase